MEIAEDSSSSMEEDTPSLVERLDSDVTARLLNYLDESIDLARFAAVSRSCHRIVVESRCFKDLCIRISPEVSRFNSVTEGDKTSISEGPSSSKDFEWTNLKIEHRVYGKLANELIGSPMEKTCICEAFCASSTDNCWSQNIVQTLNPSDGKDCLPSYWSSKGESSRDVSETLTYRLHTNLSVVHEVKIRPFQAYFHREAPIYSANAVRFRFGYSSSSTGLDGSILDRSISSDRSPREDYVWTYISEQYPMLQEDELQSFKLPRPVLCIGDIVQVELLGRVQKCLIDGLYYICVCHVYVVGRPLSSINFEVQGQPRQFILKYSEHQEHPMPFEHTSWEDPTGSASHWYSIEKRRGHIGPERVHASHWYDFAKRRGQIGPERVHAMLRKIEVVSFIQRDDQDSNEVGNINLFLH